MKIPQTKRYSIYKKLVLQDERSKKLNFEPDGREHYVYRITDYTRNMEENYYGSHTPHKNKKYDSLIDEFWTYKTSSKYNILDENKKENYKVKILKVFDNIADKIIYEAFLHQYFNVKLNFKFWNKSNQTPFNFNTDIRPSKEQYKIIGEKVSKARKGIVFSEKTKIKMSNKRKEYFENNPEARLKQSKVGSMNKGRKITEETRKKMSESQKGIKCTEAAKLKISKNSKSGTTEVRKKLSEANKGKRHPQAIIIKVYDNNDSLIFTSYGEFKKLCEKYNMPYNSFCNSYRKNVKVKKENFKNWYAIKEI